ncbi:unnamed protein product [Effrenium voratum]|uniref:Uncharacterized protein n=1 Tax=Effrenium voratum TaxID=2562239 RepID=A0AA36JQS8_9DINO|nr:unnamed protein product [Effrenium voratum]
MLKDDMTLAKLDLLYREAYGGAPLPAWVAENVLLVRKAKRRLRQQEAAAPTPEPKDSQEEAVEKPVPAVKEDSQEEAVEKPVPAVKEDSQEEAVEKPVPALKEDSQEEAVEKPVPAVKEDSQEEAVEKPVPAVKEALPMVLIWPDRLVPGKAVANSWETSVRSQKETADITNLKINDKERPGGYQP